MDELTRAKKRALYLLTDMDRTEAQLYEKLKKTGYSEETIAKAMAYVKHYGYIDDDRYASHYLEQMSLSRSKKRIRFDLNKRGVPKEIIARTFEEEGDYDEKPLIKKLAKKKARTLDLTDPKSRDKLAGFLLRKGFSSHDVFAVISKMREGQTEE